MTITLINSILEPYLYYLFYFLCCCCTRKQLDSNEEAEEEVIEEVITTGSRISRNPLELAQPVTIISGDEYRARAYTNAAQALTDLPEVGSVNSLSGDQSGLGAGQQVASNFGLGSSRTVTLLIADVC